MLLAAAALPNAACSDYVANCIKIVYIHSRVSYMPSFKTLYSKILTKLPLSHRDYSLYAKNMHFPKNSATLRPAHGSGTVVKGTVEYRNRRQGCL